jgi:hypothetical protein
MYAAYFIAYTYQCKEFQMKKNNLWLGILVLALVFGMTVVGCDNDSNEPTNGNEPKWVPPTGEQAKPFTGTLSDNGTTLTFTNWWGRAVTFSKSGGGLNGTWIAIANGERLTISDNKNWILAYKVEEEEPLPEARSGSDDYYDFAKGTLTVNDTTITFIATHIMDYGDDEGYEDDGAPSKG